MLSVDEVRDRLREECAAAGSVLAWARAHNVSQPYVRDVIQGQREPGPAILEALGLERVVSYRPAVEAPAPSKAAGRR